MSDNTRLGGVSLNTSGQSNKQTTNLKTTLNGDNSSQPPPNRIASTLSKFERNDAAAARISPITGLKPISRRTSSNNTFISTTLNNSSSPGNRFLNGKSLNSVSSNKFSVSSPNNQTSSRPSTRNLLTPSSLLSKKSAGGVGRSFLNKVPKNNKKAEENDDGPKRTLKKGEKDLLLKKLTATQLRVTQEKITER